MPSDLLRRAAAGCAFGAILLATPLAAAEYTGPDPALAPGEDKPPVGASIPSTVYWDSAGKPYVLKSAEERQYLSDYNVTWIDKNHVLTPPGVGHFD